jgi:predicted 3-demethylubiquinone-9 3-methyltransferase (glyoxalase superfamily)
MRKWLVAALRRALLHLVTDRSFNPGFNERRTRLLAEPFEFWVIFNRRQWRQESQCGWCKDKWGISWQITPRVPTEALAAGGDEAKRAFDAMMGMKKIDVATIEAARRG